MIKIIKIFIIFLCFCMQLNAATINKETIIKAVKQNDVNTLKLCLRKGISPNVQDINGNAILLLSISMGYSNIAEILIENNANVNVSYNMGMNSLMLAINKNMERVANLLIDYDVDLEAKLPNGMTALMLASEKGMFKLIKKNG